MENIFLYNPWVQTYVLVVGALWVVFFWDYYLRTSRTTRRDARKPYEKPARSEPCWLPASDGKKNRQRVSRPRQPAD
jgi:hypothetical protein